MIDRLTVGDHQSGFGICRDPLTGTQKMKAGKYGGGEAFPEEKL